MRFSPIQTHLSARIALVGAATAVAIVAGTWAWTPTSHAKGIAASTHSLNETAHLRNVSKHGASFTEQGPASGTFKCTLTLHLTTTARGVTFQLSANPPGGSLSGSGSASVESAGKIATVSGMAVFTGGSGRYGHAHASGLKVAGTFNRESYSLSVTLAGRWSY
jgi:hypothetical protein